MNIEIITEFIKIEIIQYLMIGTTTLGLINCIKLLVKGR